MVTRLGPYELLTCLAAGGMAEIYVARRGDEPERLLIVKRMLPQFSNNPAFVEMFFDEGRTVSLLHHRNVVRMHYFGFEGDTPYLAMEYLHGVDVRSILRATMHEGGQLPQALALSIMIDVCAGLHHAHEARSLDGQPLEIVHRDVSPQNVIVTFDGEIKLIDFGIARSRGRAHETKAGALKGKIPYMAPEQIRNGPMDRRTDVYAAGVMLYELLTYQRPYVVEDGQSPQGEFSLMLAIVGHQIARPRSICPTLPESLERITLRALAARPADRYQSAAAMQAELEHAARELGLLPGGNDLATFLRETFPEDAKEWRPSATSSVHELVTRIEAANQLRSELDEVATVARSRRAGPKVAPPANALGAVRLVQVPARLDESFGGAELAASLTGTVVLDLGDVRRINSYGLRQWLELNRELTSRGDQVQLYYARCSEAVVGQIGLVNAFADRGQVISFQAPYACSSCGHAFTAHFDCEHDAAELAAAQNPPRPCPLCNEPALLDDEPSFLAPLAPHLGLEVPAPVRAALENAASAPRQATAVTKWVEGQRTIVRLERPPDRGLRWSRVLDGIEGELELELELLGDDDDVHAALTAALSRLGPEVSKIRLRGAPRRLLSHLGSAGPKVAVESVAVRGRCPSCRSHRRALMPPEHFATPRGGAPAACPRCGAELVDLEPMQAAGETSAVDSPRAPPPTTSGRWRLGVLGLALVIVLSALAYALAARAEPTATAPWSTP